MESTDSSSCSRQPQLPPGFRFHPTDEELVIHYLKRKAASAPLPVAIIAEVDLYKFDPWELPRKANFGEEEWYFFSPRDRKYPNGARPNRAATSGYWKATGTDKPILTAGGTQKVGVKKALVFYGGKPPKGIKTNWIMHEYRLTDGSTTTTNPALGSNNNTTKPSINTTADSTGSSNNNNNNNTATKKANSRRLDDWVLCRIYKKNNSNTNNSSQLRTPESSMELLMPRALPCSKLEDPRPNNYSALLEHDDNFFEGLLTVTEEGIQITNPISRYAPAFGSSKVELLQMLNNPGAIGSGGGVTVPVKRSLLPSWSDGIPRAKRLLHAAANACIADEDDTGCGSGDGGGVDGRHPSYQQIWF